MQITNYMPATEKESVCDSSFAPECPSAESAGSLDKNRSLQGNDSPSTYDRNRALDGAAEEMNFAWPEFMLAQRMQAGITEIALGILAFLALIAFCYSH
jgi:hypothetical protein